MRFKIAVVQFKIKQFSPEENLKKAEVFIRKASRKADIIIFPEDFLIGGNIKEEFVDYKKRYRKTFQNLAKKYKINIIPGSFTEGEKTGLYNTSYFIDSKGRVKARYRKINLWLTERKKINFGNKICVFNTKFGKCGIVICWDLIFPEIFRRMASKGVKIIFCPSLWYRSWRDYVKYNKEAEILHVNALCQARSIENQIILVYTNASGKLVTSDGNQDEAIGHSQITAPIKGVIKRLNHRKEEMFIQEVDTKILDIEEKYYRIKQDIKKRIL